MASYYFSIASQYIQIVLQLVCFAPCLPHLFRIVQTQNTAKKEENIHCRHKCLTTLWAYMTAEPKEGGGGRKCWDTRFAAEINEHSNNEKNSERFSAMENLSPNLLATVCMLIECVQPLRTDLPYTHRKRMNEKQHINSAKYPWRQTVRRRWRAKRRTNKKEIRHIAKREI